MIINTRPVETLKAIIEANFEKVMQQPAGIALPQDLLLAIEDTLGLLDRGKVRIAVLNNERWETQTWLKQAILLYFRSQLVDEVECGPFQWVDKVPVKKWSLDMGVRVVPPATVRYGAFVGKGAVLMPSYINIGAFVDEGTMIDTWATVGSCAQVGKNVHVSGGVGIGGVLEPAQAQPVIIEDDCFIGSRCILVEGVHIRKGAVLGAGVVLTKSTPIVDVRHSQSSMFRGVVPPNCVVIPGSIPKRFPAGEVNVPCALIIGERTTSTDKKTSLNQVLREYDIGV